MLQEKHRFLALLGDFPLSSGGVAERTELGDPAMSSTTLCGIGISAATGSTGEGELILKQHSYNDIGRRKYTNVLTECVDICHPAEFPVRDNLVITYMQCV